MENIFKNSANDNPDTSIQGQFDFLKDNYSEIFVQAAESIRAELDKFKPENPCADCKIKCEVKQKDIFADYPIGCVYREWQTKSLSFLNGDYQQKLKNSYNLIMDKKCNYECNKCGTCCKLAVSEYSYNQLKQKAFRGDPFSKDFVSVFVPYESDEAARAAYPEYFENLGNITDSKIYFYYCPKLKDNMCSDYENRPDMCKNYPQNPLKILPSDCSFVAWRQEVAKSAMLIKAKTDIIDFYKEKLG